MNDEDLIKQTIQLENYLQKLNLKHKNTVLLTQKGSYRTNLYRTDFAAQLLKPEHFKHIEGIFKLTLNRSVDSFEDFLAVLGFLASRALILRLDRPPQTVKEELRKWPDKMQIAAVTSLVP